MIDTTQASILIVDDQPNNILVLKGILEKGGFSNIDSTTNPMIANVKYAQKRHHIVLIDYNMPGMTGSELIQKILSVDPNAYCIVITALADKEVRLECLDKGAKDFVNKPFDLAEIMARVKNTAISSLMARKLEEQVKEKTDQLEQSQSEIIKRLSMAAEYRDNETGNHIIRMSWLSSFLGELYGFEPDRTETFKLASAMHDVGKIGIPDHILLKPGPLTGDEWIIMKRHSMIGHDLLHNDHFPLMQMAANIAAQHHEKWDGTGYPFGLAGEDISIEARIVAIADVYDALTSVRPYKKAWTHEDAVAHIMSQKGKHFDPKLIDIFEKNHMIIQKTMEQWHD